MSGKFYMQLQKLRRHFTVHSAVWITGEFKMKHNSRSAEAFTWLARGMAVVNRVSFIKFFDSHL